jgi:hypothetical protein
MSKKKRQYSEQKWFLYAHDDDRFVEVTKKTKGVRIGHSGKIADWPEWSNGQHVLAFKEADEEPEAFWRFDVHFSGAFGIEVGAFFKLAEELQGGFASQASPPILLDD